MEIFYMIPIMLLCSKKCFSTKKSDGRVSRLVHKGPPLPSIPFYSRKIILKLRILILMIFENFIENSQQNSQKRFWCQKEELEGVDEV